MTYLATGVTFLVPAAVVLLVAGLVRRPARAWWLALAACAVVLVVLTAVFDSLMIGLDLFRFDEADLLGLRLGLAPVEDLAWPLAAVLLLPALWRLLGRERDRPGAGEGEG